MKISAAFRCEAHRAYLHALEAAESYDGSPPSEQNLLTHLLVYEDCAWEIATSPAAGLPSQWGCDDMERAVAQALGVNGGILSVNDILALAGPKI